MGRDVDAMMAYRRAAELYAAKGFEARAAATQKLMRQIQAHRLG